MTDDELQKRCEAFLGSQVVVPVYGYGHTSGNLGEFGQRELRPPELNGETAMALLEKCVAEREWLQPIVISIFPSSAFMIVSNVISFQALTTRNIIEACVLALEGKDEP